MSLYHVVNVVNKLALCRCLLINSTSIRRSSRSSSSLCCPPSSSCTRPSRTGKLSAEVTGEKTGASDPLSPVGGVLCEHGIQTVNFHVAARSSTCDVVVIMLGIGTAIKSKLPTVPTLRKLFKHMCLSSSNIIWSSQIWQHNGCVSSLMVNPSLVSMAYNSEMSSPLTLCRMYQLPRL